MHIAGNRAYTADGDEGTHVFDISNPSAPILRGAYKTSASAYDVQVIDNLMYIGELGRIAIVDVADPAHPLPRGAFETIGEALHLYVAGDLIYVADGWGGLLILRVHPERFPKPMFLPTIGH